MRVLCSTLRYYPAIGGAEVLLKNVFEHLSKKDYEFKVLATTAVKLEDIYYRKETKEKNELINGIEVRRCPITTIPYKPVLAKILDKLSIYGHGAYSYSQFRGLLNEKCDVMLSLPFPSTHNYYTFLAAKVRNKPLIFCPLLHLEDKYHSLRKSLFLMMKHSTATIALTNYEKNFYVKQGVSADRVHVIGVGVDPASFVKRKGSIKEKYGADNLITFIGRKEEYKGIETILSALRLLIRDMPDLYFLCAGPETSYSKKLWAGLPKSIRNNVIVKESISEEEKNAILSETDVFVMPSSAESFGIVYLEAWMFEKPVIGMNIDVIREVISEYHDGFLIEPRNYVELALKIKYLLENKDFALELGRNGKKKVLNEYTWDVIAPKWGAVIEEVVK
jgi:glycosyltransferase involved in cell wall biosynthesis